MFGIAGRKPTRKCIVKERGDCEFTYNRRKIVREKVTELI